MTVLLIDNYDSFTHNLFQLFGELGAEVAVHRNDAISLDEVIEMAPTHIIVSPGPGHPKNDRDFGVCRAVIDHFAPTTPLLGVCLGHQGIVHGLGGDVVRAPAIVHGKTSAIRHDGDGLFQGIPQGVEVMRYHSFIVQADTLPECLTVTAETDNGLIMGVRHSTWPLVGLQFHPESIGTPCGPQLAQNFLGMGGPA